MLTQMKLEGVSTTAKARIATYGQWWTVVGEPKDVYGGRMYYIRPSRLIRGRTKGLGSHWINELNDPDYKVLEKKEKGK